MTDNFGKDIDIPSKYAIIVKNKIFASNLTLEQCMKLSVYLGRKGINHREAVYYDR